MQASRRGRGFVAAAAVAASLAPNPHRPPAFVSYPPPQTQLDLSAREDLPRPNFRLDLSLGHASLEFARGHGPPAPPAP
jgi:hypothetical protein